MKKQTKIAAVLSAAAFMMMVSGLPVYAASYGWVTEGDAKVYYDEDGYLTTDAWRKRGEDWFYLGEDGQIVKNAKIDEYYVDDEGKMVTNAWVEKMRKILTPRRHRIPSGTTLRRTGSPLSPSG